MEHKISSVKHYYVAVGSAAAKISTLVDLLQALQDGNTRAKLATAIACSSRDSADAVAVALSDSPLPQQLAILHSDLSQSQTEQVAAHLKTLLGPATDRSPGETLQQAQQPGGPDTIPSSANQAGGPSTSYSSNTTSLQRPSSSGRQLQGAPAEGRPTVLVFTDVSLKAIGKEHLPFGLPLLIQYDFPQQKESFQRRIATVFGASKERRGQKYVVINFVVAGEVEKFRNFERVCGVATQEMPVHVPDIFG